MNITKKLFTEYIKDFNFKGLFNYLGWDNIRVKFPSIQIKNENFFFNSIAQKSSFVVLECVSTDGNIPTYSFRSKIDSELRKQIQEHMIIFTNSSKTEQVWVYSYRYNGKARKVEVSYNTSQEVERLYQRAAGLFFSIDDQENITIFDVTQRMNENFATNTEKVTKRFFDGFKRQHIKFIEFLDGVNENVDKEWYASIMLNRLMFCYFIQKRGFLDNDRDYLRNKLNECIENKGKDKFYSFYRNFLLVLFHNGLASKKHDEELTKMIGTVPYLNGGIFDEHFLEKKYPNINIDDQAFTMIFDFFDTYEWYLDSRECASGNEISPDVLGYIFEKYINDRSEMGAYYTQEDITEYISRNSVLPYLLHEIERRYKDIFAPDREIWAFLRQSGDKYIFDSAKKGVNIPLPGYIERGIDVATPNLLERRGRWNDPADEKYALPTEIWRESLERRQRYNDTLNAIQSGKINSIQDFIRYNLDICSFTQDLLDTIDDSAFVRAFYETIQEITILDPTCGSGAFLFAALNVLEPLYDSCINRMEDFLKNERFLPKNAQSLFKETINNKNQHANKKYFIIKTIILNNLYGVDIMNEAVETTKLRLFLALVSTATPDYDEDNVGIEPLPDIDFNVKCGNALIGYSSENSLEKEFELSKNSLLKQLLLYVSNETKEFKRIQLLPDKDKTHLKGKKAEICNKQEQINDILNHTLTTKIESDYLNWLKKSQPFNWYSEYYNIISEANGRGGFDIIIGNPPYVEYKSVKSQYEISGYKTEACGNLYAYVLERCQYLLKDNGIIGMIVPLSGHSTERMEPLVTEFYEKFPGRFIANFSGDANPSHLFPGVKFRLAILFVSKWFKGNYSTKYRKWYSEERPHLFETIQFNIESGYSYKNIIVKNPSPLFQSVFNKVKLDKNTLWEDKGDIICYYHNAPVSWVRAHTFTPYFCSERDGVGVSTQLKKMHFKSEHAMTVGSSILNSSLFYIWWVSQSDCYHLNVPEIKNFSYHLKNDVAEEKLIEISARLADDMVAKSCRRVYHYKTSGRVEYDEFYMKKSKDIIDEIDAALAQHYGFTEEELDWIIGYEIKYRIGVQDAQEE